MRNERKAAALQYEAARGVYRHRCGAQYDTRAAWRNPACDAIACMHGFNCVSDWNVELAL